MWNVWMAALAVVLASMSTIGPAEAQRQRERAYGTVKACSNYGNGCTTAPVRRGRFDDEFRMPGGTWVSCRRDCRTALREEVLDFWETLNERVPDAAR